MNENKILQDTRLEDLPQNDLIWMIQMLRVQRDALSAENIKLRDILSKYKLRCTAIKNMAKEVISNGEV